ncbi:hypothetical protein AWC38_SpisGene23782 [Stylophora pistillata]|uniref:Exonuclease domain-containing protein n=2 Tax=Stylophora pistillata TaxID=50429 RepID=A0A2B4R545_STYPI|nr:hypothetical protein AWC38_SpisGene23782 [Stylophora pistillata]
MCLKYCWLPEALLSYPEIYVSNAKKLAGQTSLQRKWTRKLLSLKEKQKTRQYKKKRIEKKEKRLKKTKQLENREGQQYSCGMGFDGHNAAQEIPAPPKAPKIEKIPLFYHALFLKKIDYNNYRKTGNDAEILQIAATDGNDAEILQIAATDGNDEFSIYIKPRNVLSPEASAVNKLTFQRAILFYDGKPITDAVAIDVALKTFIEWLKSRMPCILVAHNCKSFDARFLVQAAEKNGVMDDLVKTVSGFTDPLSAFRELLPERKSQSQENLVQGLLGKSYEAHNALADVQTLYQLVNKFLNVKLLQKHSFKVSWVASYQKLLKEKKLLVNTLQPLVREKYISASMAIKCASSGLGLPHLRVVYQRGKEEGVKQVLMERFDNKPRVSSNKRVLAQICQYSIDNAN